jgi:hypothetical protein
MARDILYNDFDGRNGFAPHQNHYVQALYKKTARYIGNFMYLSFAAGVFCILFFILYFML